MKKFNLIALCTIGVHTTVEAECLEDAIQIAEQRKDVMNAHFDGGADVNEHWIAEEYDGTPYDIVEDR